MSAKMGDIGVFRLIPAFVALLGACSTENIELAHRTRLIPVTAEDASQAAGGNEPSQTQSQPAATGGSNAVAMDTSWQQFCNGKSNWLTVPANANRLAKKVCMGQFASQTFRYALCSCKNADLLFTLITSAYDSRVRTCPQSFTDYGGSVGVNENLLLLGGIKIGGSLTVAGDNGLSVPAGVSTIQGDLRVKGPLSYVGAIDVRHNVLLGGNLSGTGSMTIAGNLKQTDGAGRGNLGNFTVRGNDLRDSVAIQAPCACGESEVLDIGAMVVEASAHNHNQEANFNADSLKNVTGKKEFDLPCGRIFASKIAVSGELTLQVRGRTALFVEKDVTSTGALSIKMDPAATLDLFIAGNLSVSSLQTSNARPAKLRIYVAGTQPIGLPSLTAFNLYAPNAVAQIVNVQTVCGSIFAGNIASSDFISSIASGSVFDDLAPRNVFYDASLRAEDQDCDPPAKECSRCDECGVTSACVGGLCGLCQSSANCCEPLVCSPQGQCVENVENIL
jgi:hypothetical protein